MDALRTARRWHGPLVGFAAVMLVLAGVAAVAGLLDDRVLAGAPVWAKPLKFALSFTAYALTLAWMLSRLRRWRRAGWWAGTVVVAASVAEMGIIVAQVVRGRQSHFNVSTPVDTTLFSLMGALVAVIYTGTLVVGAVLSFATTGDAATTWAVRLGVAIALAGMSVGFLMLGDTPDQAAAVAAGAPRELAGAHAVGVADGGPGLPLLGWSTVGGDLRVGHFLGMHALQVLPLLALALGSDRLRAPGRLAGSVGLGRFARLDGRARLRVVLLAAGALAGLVALTVWQALRGQALTDPDGLTLAVGAALVLATGVGAAAVTRGAARVAVPA